MRIFSLCHGQRLLPPSRCGGSMCVMGKIEIRPLEEISLKKRAPKMSILEVRSTCSKGQLTLLSKNYSGRASKIRCRCHKCDHTWNPRFSNILRGSGCPMCARAKLATAKPKLSLEEVKKLCGQRGVKCLAKSYLGRHYHLPCRCTKCSHKWSPTFGKILMGRGCPKCADRKTSERQTKPLAKLRAYFVGTSIKLLRDSHRRGKTRLCDFECRVCGHIWTAGVYSVISAKTGCIKCSRKRVSELAKLSLRQVDRRLSLKGASRIGSFTATGKPMLVRFNSCGHRMRMTLNSIAIGKGCPICNRHVKVGDNEYKEFAKKFKGQVLKIARSVSYKSRWRCQAGHVFERPLAALKYLKHFCPYCMSSIGEASARYIAETTTGLKFEKVRLPDLRGKNCYPLELDMYNGAAKIAIEHHGEQHFTPMKNWGGAKALSLIRSRDRLRRKGCKKLGIYLIEIRSLRERTSVGEFVELLRKACAAKGLTFRKPVDIEALEEQSLIGATPEVVRLFVALKRRAAERKYKLLERSYLGSRRYHRMRCPNGHTFEAIPNKFMSGRGCPKCPRVSPNRIPVVLDGRKNFASIKAAADYLGVQSSSLSQALATTGRCRGHSIVRT